VITESDASAGTGPLDEEQRARAGIYSLLGALLAGPPDAELLDSLSNLQPGTGVLAPVWEQLAQAARQARPAQLQEEYHALFIGLGRGELVPYASWYLTGFLMEKPLAQLRADLRKIGFARQDGVAEPEDHAAAICEIMAMIIVENRLYLNEQSTFFTVYVGSWLPRFFQDVGGAESADFYRAVGRLGSRLMDVEQQYFAMPA